MTRAGYISDRRCPGNPEHGPVLGMRQGGYYCPHHTHDFPTESKNWWNEDEFEQAKLAPVPQPNGKQKLETPSDRRNRRRR